VICKEEDVIRVSALRGKFRDLYRKEFASNLFTLIFFGGGGGGGRFGGWDVI